MQKSIIRSQNMTGYTTFSTIYKYAKKTKEEGKDIYWFENSITRRLVSNLQLRENDILYIDGDYYIIKQNLANQNKIAIMRMMSNGQETGDLIIRTCESIADPSKQNGEVERVNYPTFRTQLYRSFDNVEIQKRSENVWEAYRMRKDGYLNPDSWEDIYPISENMVQISVMTNSGISYYNFFVDNPRLPIFNKWSIYNQLMSLI